MRRILIPLLGLLVAHSGLAIPKVDLCANMPCCVRPSTHDAASMNRPCCCNEVNCSDIHPQQFVSIEKTKHLTSAANLPRVFRLFERRQALPLTPFRAESPPGTTQRRLAQLSVLTI